MSYLNALRLHFAGQFQANVSTVNNDPNHFNNATFTLPTDWEVGPSGVGGWWNPQGDAAFRLLGCKVTSAWLPSGQVPASDPVLSFLIADADKGPPGKLVDLDSEQQMVSTIWGLTVRIADAQGNTLLQGDYLPAAFTDLWVRAPGKPGIDVMSSMYQSVLHNLVWNDVSASPFLTELRRTSEQSGRLSIKFNVDGYHGDYKSPAFACGRIVGTIGPAAADEPRHMVRGRQLMANLPADTITPVGKINFCAGIVDAAAGALYLDLGNALPTAAAGGSMADLGSLVVSAGGTSLGVLRNGAGGYAQDPDWYPRTGGVVVFPLTSAQVQAAAQSPISIASDTASTTSISEWPNGAWVRADTYVYRLSPGETVEIPVYATQWGKPLSGVDVTFVQDPSGLQPDPNVPVATPDTVLTYTPTQQPLPTTAPGQSYPPVTLTTDARGIVILPITATDPGTPRYFADAAGNPTIVGIDGQVYGVTPSFADPAYGGPSGTDAWPQDIYNFISFLVWSGFVPSDPTVGFTGTDLYPVFKQYANLYPVMNRFLDMGDYDQVVANARLLEYAFALHEANPNTMPVTRDLSPAKRAAILAWLKKPDRGDWPATPAPAPAPAPAPEAAAAAAPRANVPPQPGKSAALSRRLDNQRRQRETPA